MVGNTLRRCTRTGDSVGPWGGEEFLVLVVATVTSTAEAIAVAERARKLVASTWIHQGDRRIGITLSAGVALAQPGERPEEVVDRADLAMLMAKRHGRDRTVLA
jgi:diguanylate cyclase (GGDEF)-like protein